MNAVPVGTSAALTGTGTGTGTGFAVSVDVDDGVATLTMDDGKHNALTAAAFGVLEAALRDATGSENLQAVVLASARARFCVGADLSVGPRALADLIVEDGGADAGWLEPAGRISDVLRRSPVPVVVAVGGDAIGGGATITLGADVRVVSPRARFGFPFSRVGVVPEGGCTWLLPRLVGQSRAVDWLLSGRTVDAQEALAAGLVREVVEPDQLITRAVTIARDLGRQTSPTARRRVLNLLDAGWSGTFDDARRQESDALQELSESPDNHEGILAFLERRQPRFARVAAPRQQGPRR